MIIREGTNQIELQVTERVPADLPTPGDTRFMVDVSSNGFAGRASAWVSRDEMRRFCDQLAAIESEQLDRATMVSMSPSDMVIAIEATDRWRHLAIYCRLAEGDHAVECRFAFCPSMLRLIRAEFAQLAAASE